MKFLESIESKLRWRRAAKYGKHVAANNFLYEGNLYIFKQGLPLTIEQVICGLTGHSYTQLDCFTYECKSCKRQTTDSWVKVRSLGTSYVHIVWALAACILVSCTRASVTAPVQTCTITETSSGATVTCPDGTSVNVSNGLNGEPGAPGAAGPQGSIAPTTPYTPVAILAPCAKNPMSPTQAELSNTSMEIFILLQNGMIIDTFSRAEAGDDTHLGVLTPGTYESTGYSNCVFTVHDDGTITNNLGG